MKINQKDIKMEKEETLEMNMKYKEK